ncbi:MAG: prolipoprotein diacylglyceryl transferase [Clostridia bacterium]|nr:prolipoprotein diacylglyceryl transferase [Clostridia bacterium]
MYPNELFLGMTLYDVFLALGVISALMIFNYFSRKRGLEGKLHNFILVDTVLSVVLGYVSAVLVQELWNSLEKGKYELSGSSGATFLGGLLGGAAVFLSFYFIAGGFVFKDGLHKRRIASLLDIAAVCIPSAHAFGRIGCLSAGCCYGRKTTAWYGIKMVDLGYKVVPLQLFESIFLFGLFIVLFILCKKKIHGLLPIYMIVYGLWRIPIEFLRDDHRGNSFVSFLTPSQFVSVLLIVGGVALWFFLRAYWKKHSGKNIGKKLAAEKTN